MKKFFRIARLTSAKTNGAETRYNARILDGGLPADLLGGAADPTLDVAEDVEFGVDRMIKFSRTTPCADPKTEDDLLAGSVVLLALEERRNKESGELSVGRRPVSETDPTLVTQIDEGNTDLPYLWTGCHGYSVLDAVTETTESAQSVAGLLANA